VGCLTARKKATLATSVAAIATGCLLSFYQSAAPSAMMPLGPKLRRILGNSDAS
jgi:hypothetical protein